MEYITSVCPIWDDESYTAVIDTWPRVFNSPRAGGRFQLMESGAPLLDSLTDRQKVNLSYWICRHNLRYRLFDESPELDKDLPGLDKQWIEKHRDRTPSASERVLTYLRELIRSDDAGQVPSRERQRAAGGCRIDVNDLGDLEQYAMDCGWLDRRYGVTLPARIHVEEQLRDLGTGRNGFVAMWFDDSMNEVYEKGIRPAICAAGYEPVRIDRREFLGNIPDEILAEIRKSRFVVADFTCCKQCVACETCKNIGAPGGVYYEAGFARGLGIPVIHTVHEDCMDDVHFDTSSINHITWEDPKDLQEKLHRRIEATLGPSRRDLSEERSGRTGDAAGNVVQERPTRRTP